VVCIRSVERSILPLRGLDHFVKLHTMMAGLFRISAPQPGLYQSTFLSALFSIYLAHTSSILVVSKFTSSQFVYKNT
jgi:hypothetical protein